jgi:hypothetical protein
MAQNGSVAGSERALSIKRLQQAEGGGGARAPTARRTFCHVADAPIGWIRRTGRAIRWLASEEVVEIVEWVERKRRAEAGALKPSIRCSRCHTARCEFSDRLFFRLPVVCRFLMPSPRKAAPQDASLSVIQNAGTKLCIRRNLRISLSAALFSVERGRQVPRTGHLPPAQVHALTAGSGEEPH